MQKKRHKPVAYAPAPCVPEPASSMSDQLWVRPNSNLIQEPREADARNITSASAKRLLELADVALGLKKGNAAKKTAKLVPAEAHHQRLLQRKKPPSHSN